MDAFGQHGGTISEERRHEFTEGDGNVARDGDIDGKR